MKTDPLMPANTRRLRRDRMPAALKLRHAPKAKRAGGGKDSRQLVVGSCVIDFCARAERLVTDVEGPSHGLTEAQDAARTRFLDSKGYRVIRLSDPEVMTNLEGAQRAIGAALAASPLPTLAPEGKRLLESRP